MRWNTHSELQGNHAFLSGSKYHWLGYDDDRLIDVYHNVQAVERGIRLHSLAAELISLNQRLPRSPKTLNMYVNDSIGFKMVPEQVLFYSNNCFGTADAISFMNGFLRIHDLKTGETPAHMEQLLIYSAIFCLEYRVDPDKIESELRIYQNDEVLYHRPEAIEIRTIMDKIVRFDKLIERERAVSARE